MDSYFQSLLISPDLALEQDNARTHFSSESLPAFEDDENDFVPTRFVRRSLSQEDRVAEKKQRSLLADRLDRVLEVFTRTKEQQRLMDSRSAISFDKDNKFASKYKSIEDVGERAYAILVDLEMIEETK